MTKKLSVGALVGALLLSGALVGVSFAGGGGITQPEEIVLSVNICGGPGPCRFFPLRDSNGHRTGQVTLAKNPLSDVDGNPVGHVNTSCVASAGPPGGDTNWVCTYVHTLKAGPYTEHGTVVTTGIYASGDDDRDVFAVTGGTGAYVNVRGYATWEYDRNLGYILHLIP